MAINNDGHLLDSSGSVAVDFVWGPLAPQPNDERAASISQIGSGSGDYSWSATTMVASGRLDPALDNHSAIEAGWAAYPSYYPAIGNFIVTAASGNGTTVTYTSQNTLEAGASVNITGCTTGAFNLSAATVATADKTKFTVTNGAGSGVSITGQYAKVQDVTAAGSGDGSGLGYIVVPNVLGATTAVALDALKDAGYEAANITTASAASNVGKTITAVARSAGLATFQVTSASHGFVAGNKVTISDVSGGDGINGVWTVGAVATNTFEVLGTATTVQALTSLAGVVSGVVGTIKTQSVAAGTASVATTATITITPFAAAS